AALRWLAHACGLDATFNCIFPRSGEARLPATTHSVFDVLDVPPDRADDATLDALIRRIDQFEAAIVSTDAGEKRWAVDMNRAVRIWFNLGRDARDDALRGCLTRVLRIHRAENSEITVRMADRIRRDLAQLGRAGDWKAQL